LFLSREKSKKEVWGQIFILELSRNMKKSKIKIRPHLFPICSTRLLRFTRNDDVLNRDLGLDFFLDFFLDKKMKFY